MRSICCLTGCQKQTAYFTCAQSAHVLACARDFYVSVLRLLRCEFAVANSLFYVCAKCARPCLRKGFLRISLATATLAVYYRKLLIFVCAKAHALACARAWKGAEGDVLCGLPCKTLKRIAEPWKARCLQRRHAPIIEEKN